MTESRGALTREDGSTLAWRRVDGEGPTVVWLGGVHSDMTGTKAEVLAEQHAAQRADGRELCDELVGPAGDAVHEQVRAQEAERGDRRLDVALRRGAPAEEPRHLQREEELEAPPARERVPRNSRARAPRARMPVQCRKQHKPTRPWWASRQK